MSHIMATPGDVVGPATECPWVGLVWKPQCDRRTPQNGHRTPQDGHRKPAKVHKMPQDT